jgi:hypothetical protein
MPCTHGLCQHPYNNYQENNSNVLPYQEKKKIQETLVKFGNMNISHKPETIFRHIYW